VKVRIGTYPKKDKERVVKIQIDPWDTWSMDHTLALIIVPMLKQLKETTHGGPAVDNNDVPEELKSTSAPPVKEHGVDDNYFKRWDWVLEEMIWAFTQLSSENDDAQFFDHSEVDEGEDFIDQLKKIKVDEEGLTAHNKRIDNGLLLFGKYYRGLWD